MTDETSKTDSTPPPAAPKSSGTRTLAAIVLGALLGSAVMYAVPRLAHRHSEGAEQPANQQRYHCPMHPSYTSDKPGDCPICGMKLTPIDEAAPPAGGPRKLAGDGGSGVDGLATVRVDAQRQQMIGMRLAPVTVGQIGTGWRTVGRVTPDETRVHRVNVKVDGFVEKLYADFIGKPVRVGEPLLTLYSPELFSVQNEYLLARETQRRLATAGGQASKAGDDLVAAARRRLELWDIPQSELESLETTGKARRTLTLTSPYSGVITAKTVVQGSKIAAGDAPFEITDLSHVWVLADAYESDFRRVKPGLKAEFRLAAFPGQVFRGQVTFIEPVVDPKTRTARMRLSFTNPRGELRPEMFGEVAFQAKLRDVLRVPFDAVIDSGEQTVVFVSLGEGKFEPRLIKVGAQSSDFVEVVSGLKAGEQVVSRANFLIDSESRLKAALAAIAVKPAAEPAADGGSAAPHAGHGKQP